jgi:steroid 5-alpha reductase family enzyme
MPAVRRLGAFASVALAYLFAAGVALAVGRALAPAHGPLFVAAAADVAATLAVFAFSFAFRNSSFYDPYWSVAPLPIALYWALSSHVIATDVIRQVAVVALVAVWGARLTSNWARGWQGLHHEDWRYVDLRRATGRAYWAVSFLGLHLIPTLIVFLGCLPLYPALATGVRPFGAIDVLAIAVTASAIALESRADQQLRRFVARRRDASELLDRGLWARSRHPNYFGEILFWWGLYLFGLAADPSSVWTLSGPLAVTGLFHFVSLPMIEKRMLERKPGFAAYRERTSLLIPWTRART